MGLEIKKLWIEAEELRDRITRMKSLYPIPNRHQQRNLEDAKLKLNDLTNKLDKIGSGIPITIITICADHRTSFRVKRRIMYTTHDDFELEAMFRRDFPNEAAETINKVFTAIAFPL